MTTLFQAVKNASKKVDKIEDAESPSGHLFYGRTLYSILSSTTAELGELADEIRIHEGHSYKVSGKDGVVGEAIDAIACLLDLIHRYDPNLAEKDLVSITEQKVAKWVEKVSKHKRL